jgi:multidrug efflux pump subunit AcrB
MASGELVVPRASAGGLPAITNTSCAPRDAAHRIAGGAGDHLPDSVFPVPTRWRPLIVFSSIAVAWGGGFIMIWFYGQDWFANFHLFGVNMRENCSSLHPINLSVAVWVGFLALFGIAVDDGVVLPPILKQSFAARNAPNPSKEIRAATLIRRPLRRVRPCLMTSATTILALLPS